jgi:hypothetical protein
VEEKKQTQQRIITTNKIVDVNNFGILPENINRLFEISTLMDINYSFYRKGVNRSTSSFLECIIDAMLGQTKLSFVLSERKKLAEIARTTGICRQELYDNTPEEIGENLSDLKTYMNPRLYIHLLEKVYKCNIMIFTQENISGEMVLPRYLQAYLKQKTNYPCVCILEHMGSESDQAQYPQCELITQWDETLKKSFYKFEVNSVIYNSVLQVYNKLSLTYKLDKQVTLVDFPFPETMIKGQEIDSYGKCRKLHISYQGKDACIFLSPVMPFATPEVYGKNVAMNLSDAMSFIEFVNMKNVYQVVKSTTIEISGMVGNVKVSIPIKDTMIASNIRVSESNIAYTPSVVSTLDMFNRNRKLAIYLTEYIFWSYSRFLYDNDTELMNDATIEMFVSDNILIDNNFIYGNVSKTFSLNSGVMKDNKIVVHDNETLKRLVYVLKLNIQRQPEKILLYHERLSIENYYNDISDFVSHPTQVILYGPESVSKWVSEKNLYYKLYHTVNTTTLSPYFFKNKLVDNTVFLAQNCDTLEKAINVGKVWVSEHFNIGMDAVADMVPSFTLYSYKSSYDIKKYYVEGYNSNNLQIIGYKLTTDDTTKSQFTVLLELE